jgi:hypothetical protein
MVQRQIEVAHKVLKTEVGRSNWIKRAAQKLRETQLRRYQYDWAKSANAHLDVLLPDSWHVGFNFEHVHCLYDTVSVSVTRRSLVLSHWNAVLLSSTVGSTRVVILRLNRTGVREHVLSRQNTHCCKIVRQKASSQDDRNATYASRTKAAWPIADGKDRVPDALRSHRRRRVW